jgi:hypothetical protein
MSARAIAAALNERKIPTPAGGSWHSVTVIRVQKRLGLATPSLLTLRILRPLRLGVCGEFSDYSLEGFGWPSGRTRLDCGPDALCGCPCDRARL